MTTKSFDKFIALRDAAMKDLATIGKARDAAHLKAQTAVAEYKKLSTQYDEMASRLGLEAEEHTDQMEIESAPKAAKASSDGVRLKKDGTPKKKPGPKASGVKAAAEKAEAVLAPKAKKAAASANGVRLKKDGTPKKKPGPKASSEPVAKAAATGTGKKKNRAAEGRRAVLAGERPSLKDGIRQVMGSKIMSTQEVYDALKAKGWLPNSNDPKGYVGYTLSADKKTFDRVPDKGRGFYRLKEENATTPKKETVSKKDTDTVMEDARAILGVN